MSENPSAVGVDNRIGSLSGILGAKPAPRPRLAPVAPPAEPSADETSTGGSEDAREPVEPAPAAHTTPVTTDEAPTRRTRTAARKSAPKKSGKKPAPAADAKASAAEGVARTHATEATQQRVVCRIPEDLHRQVAVRAAEQRTSQAAVVLEAVEAAHVAGALRERLEAATVAPVSSTGLFTGTRPREWAAAKVTLDFRLHHRDVATLDQLVADYTASDRTSFIVAALEHLFTTTG